MNFLKRILNPELFEKCYRREQFLHPAPQKNSNQKRRTDLNKIL